MLIKTTKNMKKVIYALFLPLVVVSGLVLANRGSKIEATQKSTPTPVAAATKPIPKPITAAERAAALKQWYTTPGGIAYRNWETSPEGKKVLASAAKIQAHVRDSSDMEAVITSLSLPPGSLLGFGVMVRIDADDYILTFEPEKSQLEQLQSLKVNDKIMLRGHAVSHAPKYAYPIVSGEYLERDGKIIYKRIPRKDGC